MADGAVTLTVTLDADTAARLDAVAREAGVAPESLIVDLIQDTASVRELDAQRRALSRLALSEYDETGEAHSLEDVLRDVRLDLEARLSGKA
jgi:predicted transcriptional regulator